MSEENVEIWVRGREAFSRGDWAAAAETYDPYILLRNDARWPEPFVFGREAAVRFYRGLEETAGSDVDYGEIVDLGDRILVRDRWKIHGQLSGAEGEQNVSAIVTFRAGLIVLVEYFLDHAEALKAVGLEA